MVQNFCTNGGQSHLKLLSSVKKCCFCFCFFSLTLNANIFQYVQSNFVKFLPHDLRQVKYKILLLGSNKKYICFVFLDEHSKNCSFECFLIEK